jgi:hypothetical protein
MAKVIPFPRVDGAAAASSTTQGLSRAELRETAWTNMYRAERRLGVPPELAYQRAEEHTKRFDALLNSIGNIMAEVG